MQSLKLSLAIQLNIEDTTSNQRSREAFLKWRGIGQKGHFSICQNQNHFENMLSL